MVKTQTNTGKRREIRKKIRDCEICPHCSLRQKNLEEHIRREHSLKCEICGKLFGHRQQWVNHMRDLHDRDEKVAERESKESKIDKWLKNERHKKGSRKKAAMKAAASTLGDMDEEDEKRSGAMAMGPPCCVDCGVVGPAEAIDLARCGLEFRCLLIGKPCGSASGHIAGSGAFAAPVAPTGTSVFGAPTGTSLFGSPPGSSLFGAPPGTSLFGAPLASLAPPPFAAAQAMALARASANVAVSDGEDEDL